MKVLATISGALFLSVVGCQHMSQSEVEKKADEPVVMTPAEAKTAPAPKAAAAPSADAPKYASFGAAPRLSDADAIPVEKMLASPDQYKGKYVRLTGTVEKVCPSKGCWLTLKGPGDGEALFVKFPDPAEGRLIPLDAAGKPAIVEGIVRVRDIPEEVAKHYAGESGATPEQLAKITGPQKQVTVASPCAMVQGVKSGQDSQ